MLLTFSGWTSFRTSINAGDDMLWYIYTCIYHWISIHIVMLHAAEQTYIGIFSDSWFKPCRTLYPHIDSLSSDWCDINFQGEITGRLHIILHKVDQKLFTTSIRCSFIRNKNVLHVLGGRASCFNNLYQLTLIISLDHINYEK